MSTYHPMETSQLIMRYRDKPMDMFQIRVGPQNVEFMAARKVLCQSQVLGKLCGGSWLENSSRIIDLPEDDPVDIHLLLGFLRSEKAYRIPSIKPFVPSNSYTVDEFLIFADKLSDLFILGDKYAIQSLQEAVIRELEKNEALIKSPLYFLRVARKIWGASADNNNLYWTYFHRHFRYTALDLTHPELVKVCEELRESGEHFAMNILTAQEDRFKILSNGSNAELALMQAKKDSYKLFSEHLKQQNQELAEKWAMESVSHVHTDTMMQRIRDLEQQLMEMQGGALFKKVQELEVRLSLAGKSHKCDHPTHVQCGFEDCDKQSQSALDHANRA